MAMLRSLANRWRLGDLPTGTWDAVRVVLTDRFRELERILEILHSEFERVLSFLSVSREGRVGIGTETPSAKLHVLTAEAGAAVIRVQNNSSSGYSGIEYMSTSGTAVLFFGVDHINTTTRFNSLGRPIVILISSVEVARVTGTGIGIGINPAHPLHLASGAHCTAGGTWTNSSSVALKEEITALPSGTCAKVVLDLRPVRFRYKGTEEWHNGFIAEDVPDLVATVDRKGLASMDIVAVAVGALQELSQRFETLEARVKTLEQQAQSTSRDTAVAP
jgi:Chaperone of endosialidase